MQIARKDKYLENNIFLAQILSCQVSTGTTTKEVQENEQVLKFN